MMNLRDTSFFSPRLTTYHAEFTIMANWHAFHSLSRFTVLGLQITGFYSLYDRTGVLWRIYILYIIISQVIGRFFGIRPKLLPDVAPCMCIVKRRHFFKPRPRNFPSQPRRLQGYGIVKDRSECCNIS